MFFLVKAINGAIPVPGPIIIIGLLWSAGNLKFLFGIKKFLFLILLNNHQLGKLSKHHHIFLYYFPTFELISLNALPQDALTYLMKLNKLCVEVALKVTKKYLNQFLSYYLNLKNLKHPYRI